MRLYEANAQLDDAMEKIDQWIADNPEAIAANGGLIPDEVQQEYNALVKEAEGAVEYNALQVLELAAEHAAIMEEIDRLEHRAKRAEKTRVFRERMLAQYLTLEGVEQVKTPRVTVKFKKNPPKVVAPLWSQLELGQFWASPKYDWCVTRSEPTFALNRAKIKEYIQAIGTAHAGDALPEGITLVQDTVLVIK